MIIKHTYGVYGASPSCKVDVPWEEYCKCRFGHDAALEVRCNSKPGNICPIGICLPGSAPWTDWGADQRGIPRLGAELSVTAQKRQDYERAVAIAATGAETARGQRKLLTNIALGIGAFGIAIVIAGSAAALSRKKQ
jgi:hypothetical protein